MKKLISILLVSVLFLSLSGCEYYESMKKITCMTYNTEIFNGAQNHETYSGLRSHAANAKISYFENTVENEFFDNFTTIIEEGHDFIWCIQGEATDIMVKEGVKHPDVLFGIMDGYIENIPDNFVTISFKEHEGGFLAGYIAAKASEAGKIGFIAGEESKISKKYEAGFIAGANYANTLIENPVEIEILYTGDDYNKALAKEGALTLYNEKECDILFHSLQSAATGAIDGAVEADKFIIGNGTDQVAYAGDNVLISVLKNTKLAITTIVNDYIEKEPIAGTNFVYGVKDRLISLSRNNKYLDRKIYNEANDIRNKISNGDILVPENEEELSKYIAKLQEAPAVEVENQ